MKYSKGLEMSHPPHYHCARESILSILECPLCPADWDSSPQGHEQGYGSWEECNCDGQRHQLPSNFLRDFRKDKRRVSLQGPPPPAAAAAAASGPAPVRLEIGRISGGGGVQWKTCVTIREHSGQRELAESRDAPTLAQGGGHRRRSYSHAIEAPPRTDRLAIDSTPPPPLLAPPPPPPPPSPRAAGPAFPRLEFICPAALRGPPRRGDSDHLREIISPVRPPIPEEEEQGEGEKQVAVPRHASGRGKGSRKSRKGGETSPRRRGEENSCGAERADEGERFAITWNDTEARKPQERGGYGAGPSIPEGDVAPGDVCRKAGCKKCKRAGASSSKRRVKEITWGGEGKAAGESSPLEDKRSAGEEERITITWNHAEVTTPKERGGADGGRKRASKDKEGSTDHKRASKDKGKGSHRRASKDKGSSRRDGDGVSGSGSLANPRDISSGGGYRPTPIDLRARGGGGPGPASPRDISAGDYGPSPTGRGTGTPKAICVGGGGSMGGEAYPSYNGRRGRAKTNLDELRDVLSRPGILIR